LSFIAPSLERALGHLGASGLPHIQIAHRPRRLFLLLPREARPRELRFFHSPPSVRARRVFLCFAARFFQLGLFQPPRLVGSRRVFLCFAARFFQLGLFQPPRLVGPRRFFLRFAARFSQLRFFQAFLLGGALGFFFGSLARLALLLLALPPLLLGARPLFFFFSVLEDDLGLAEAAPRLGSNELQDQPLADGLSSSYNGLRPLLGPALPYALGFRLASLLLFLELFCAGLGLPSLSLAPRRLVAARLLFARALGLSLAREDGLLLELLYLHLPLLVAQVEPPLFDAGLFRVDLQREFRFMVRVLLGRRGLASEHLHSVLERLARLQ